MSRCLTTVVGPPGAGSCRPPVIAVQPVIQQVNAGDNATFSVVVTGTGPFYYQWKRNGVVIAGATSSSYNITNASVAISGLYSVRVSNACGTVESADGYLNVFPTGSGYGEANDGANIGPSGVGIYDHKTGVTLEFKKLVAGSNQSIIDNGDGTITLSATGGTTKDSFTVSTDAVRLIPAGKDVTLIRIKSSGGEAAFSAGFSNGAGDIIFPVSLLPGVWSQFPMSIFNSNSYNIYFNGITSSMDIVIVEN